ncbi:DUF3261 domain-containing protein [Vibrio fluvialis]|uniref:DUF3261 domain-containing protein n=1 Tax=Vibrio fluvialis TaxID=676 RepID=UPI00117FD01F|nr:DUF3261 domain-containing protein [Vibrio fluvialis]MBL4245838.1 DUF3261 domain-containing protein [Vibrio fluvialis]MBL4256603.1 DUF3261 domain-containing protein [Vibrio fluvialis]MBY8019736.1 DUF3261 domain-containing protein [Vibrio fluvialis]MBY8276612.1 DUF3261 domain-containing protein [Vibrio fluvialis]MCG6358187.1 DUF3261 domain-containing protein [Vibrio fluvialis]
MKWLLTSLMSLWLCACSLQPQISATQVEICPDVWVELPKPAQLSQSFTASQLISATWHNETGHSQSQQLPVQLQVSDQQVLLAGFSSWGTRILSLDYDGEQIQTQVLSGLENTVPKPEQVLFNLMITLWPRNAWEAPLNKVRWRIIDDANQRTVINEKGETILAITYSGDTPLSGDIHFKNLPLNYDITIQTLTLQPTQTASQQ